MKIEYMEESQDGPVIRLFDFSPAEVTELKKLLDKMAKGEIKTLSVHEHCNINPDDNCHLTFVSSNEDKGVEPQGDGFACTLTPSSFSGMSELVGSFAFHPSEGYEWLDETGRISLLISLDRNWSGHKKF